MICACGPPNFANLQSNQPLILKRASASRPSGAESSGNLLPPSPPGEKATARQDQAGQPRTRDGTGDCHCRRTHGPKEPRITKVPSLSESTPGHTGCCRGCGVVIEKPTQRIARGKVRWPHVIAVAIAIAPFLCRPPSFGILGPPGRGANKTQHDYGLTRAPPSMLATPHFLDALRKNEGDREPA
jgi:hypothetical protein